MSFPNHVALNQTRFELVAHKRCATAAHTHEPHSSAHQRFKRRHSDLRFITLGAHFIFAHG